MQPGDKSDDLVAGTGIGRLLFCVAVGAVFFYLARFTYARVTATALPTALIDLWSAFPLIGGLLVNALTALATYWLIAAALGFAIAAAARGDYVFYGALATGVFLTLNATSSYDGWQAFVEVGPEFWLALRTDALVHDPFGTLSRWLALPVCAWLWGRWLFDTRSPRSSQQ